MAISLQVNVNSVIYSIRFYRNRNSNSCYTGADDNSFILRLCKVRVHTLRIFRLSGVYYLIVQCT